MKRSSVPVHKLLISTKNAFKFTVEVYENFGDFEDAAKAAGQTVTYPNFAAWQPSEYGVKWMLYCEAFVGMLPVMASHADIVQHILTVEPRPAYINTVKILLNWWFSIEKRSAPTEQEIVA